MSASASFIEIERFSTFGDLLKYLRRRAGLTQRELSIAVGYSIAQISRLELNQRLPDLAMIAARFVPALDLEEEADIARRLMELAAAVRSEDAPASGAPPYKGLNFFDEADADLYFGREALVAKLASRVLGQRAGAQGSGGDSSSSQPPGSSTPSPFLAVVGASGSGKSSVVRAGLVHALRWKSPSANWPVHLLTPTARPLEALALSLTREVESATATATLMDDFRRDPRALHLWARRLLSPEAGASASRNRRGEPSPSRLGRASPARLVLVVDQFEELFTLCQDDVERAAFVDNLLTAAFEPDGPICLVITLRADFYAYCAPYAALRTALAEHQEYIGPMSADELRQAIEEPARRGGWELEAGLAEVILHDLGAEGSRSPEPGALPLLSHALLETWHRRRGRALTLSGYLASGGVRGAIAETAETVFRDQLDAPQQAIARNIFLRLTALGDDEEIVWTRRRVAFDELIPTAAEAVIVREVLTCLADARLITTSEAAAEVAHEALLREWPRLNDWLINNRANIRLQRQLTNAAAEWRRANHDPGFLLTGARLAQFESLVSQNALTLTQDERAYLEASLAERDRQALEARERQQRELEAAQKLAATEQARANSERQRAEEQVRYVARVRTRNRAIAIAGVVAFILAVVAGVFGLQSNQNATLAQQNLSAAQIANTQSAESAEIASAEKQNALEAQAKAEQAAKIAFSRELASAALANLDVDPERSILLALEAVSQTYAINQTALPEAEDALHQAVGASRVQLTLPCDPAWWTRLAFSPDGTRLASDLLGGKRIWEVATGKELFTLPLENTAGLDIVFSPDGTRVTTADFNQYGEVTIETWEIISGHRVLTTPVSANIHDFRWETLSPDGRLYATALSDNTVRVWDTATGQLLHTLSGHTAQITNIAFNRNGTQIVTGSNDNTAKIWDVGSSQLLRTLSGQRGVVLSAAFSPDARSARVATTNGDFTATVWDAATGQELRILFGHTNDVTAVQFSPDGKRLATVSWDRKGIVWEVETGQQLFTLSGHTGAVFNLAFSPDGTRLATSSTDGTVKLWDVSSGGELPTLPINAFFSSAFNPEQTRIAIVHPDWTAGIWDMTTGKSLLTLSDPLGIHTVAFSPDGTRLVTTNPPNKIMIVWDAATGDQLLRLTELDVIDASFSPDGMQIVTAHFGGSVKVWEATTGKLLLTLSKHNADVYTVAYSLDGSRIVSAADDGTVKVWDAKTGQELLSLQHSNTGSRIPWGLDFSPDGKRFVTGSQAGTAKVWDLEIGQELVTLSGHSGTIYRVAYSPDGTQIATAAYDSTARVWDAATGKLLLTLYGAMKGLNGITFSLDGKRLITVSDDGNMRTYLLSLEDELALARSRLTRTWRLEECQQYLHVAQCPQP